jgi:hypothetical protein
MTTKEELRKLRAEAKTAREESLRLWRDNLAEMRLAEVAVQKERANRERAERDKTVAILARLRAGGASATERAICRELRVSPKRVVRLRALLHVEQRNSAGRTAAAEPAASPLARVWRSLGSTPAQPALNTRNRGTTVTARQTRARRRSRRQRNTSGPKVEGSRQQRRFPWTGTARASTRGHAPLGCFGKSRHPGYGL